MAAERFVRGPVHREDGQAKTFPSNNLSLQVPGMSQGRFVRLYRGLPLRVTYLIILWLLYQGKNRTPCSNDTDSLATYNVLVGC